jgi:hypothetical protein
MIEDMNYHLVIKTNESIIKIKNYSKKVKRFSAITV